MSRLLKFTTVCFNLVIALAYLGLLAVYGTVGMSILLSGSTMFVLSLIEVTWFLALATLLVLFVFIMVSGIIGAVDTICKLFPGKI